MCLYLLFRNCYYCYEIAIFLNVGFHTSDKSHEQIESTYVTTANSVNVSKANVLPTPVIYLSFFVSLHKILNSV